MAKGIQKKVKKKLKIRKVSLAFLIPSLMMILARSHLVSEALITFIMKIDEAFLNLLKIQFYSEKNVITLFKDNTLLSIYFTKDCIGITPLSLMLGLILISKSKNTRNYLIISTTLLFSTLIVNIIRILSETYFYVKNPSMPEYLESVLFPVVNIVYVFLVWFFMLQRKYIYIDIWQRKG